MTKYTIEDLKFGRVALECNTNSSNDASKLKKIMAATFTNDFEPAGDCLFYKAHRDNTKWSASNTQPSIPSITVGQFYADNFSTPYTLEDLRDGKVILEHTTGNDISKLEPILKAAFPNHRYVELGGSKPFYGASENIGNFRTFESPVSDKAHVTVEDFYNTLYPQQHAYSTNSQSCTPTPIGKVIGYKLNGIVTAREVSNLMNCSAELYDGLFYKLPDHSNGVDKAKAMGILDIWFTPVYEQPKPDVYEFTLSNGEQCKVNRFNAQVGGFTMDVHDVKRMLIATPWKGHTVRATGWLIGCDATPKVFTREDAENVLEYHAKLL